MRELVDLTDAVRQINTEHDEQLTELEQNRLEQIGKLLRQASSRDLLNLLRSTNDSVVKATEAEITRRLEGRDPKVSLVSEVGRRSREPRDQDAANRRSHKGVAMPAWTPERRAKTIAALRESQNRSDTERRDAVVLAEAEGQDRAAETYGISIHTIHTWRERLIKRYGPDFRTRDDLATTGMPVGGRRRDPRPWDAAVAKTAAMSNGALTPDE